MLERAFVRVEGPDAETYLQGQLSQDVAGLEGSKASFLLEPTGKVVALLRVTREAGDRFLLDTDAEAGDAMLARLRKYLLRTNATIELVDGMTCVRVFGDTDGVPAVWPEPAPVDRFGASDDSTLEVTEYHRRRIEAGVPISGVDIGAETIPAEVGAWAIEAAASFSKGCYTGQELVARIDSRGGNVPRPLRVLRLSTPVEAGAEIVDADGKPAGHVTSAAADVALGPCARRLELGAVVTVGGVTAVVER